MKPVKHTLPESALATIEDLEAQMALLEEAYHTILREGVDFATIPGTPRPTLLQPGAEKLARIFNLTVTEEILNMERSGDFLHVVVRVQIYRGDNFLGSATGSANTYETRYRYRWINAPRPPESEIQDLIARGLGRWTKNQSGQWVWQRKVENPDKYDLFNTVIKMAAKRAFVQAIKRFTAASSFFLVDIEELKEAGMLDDSPDEAPHSPPSPPARSQQAAPQQEGGLSDATRRRLHAALKDFGLESREQQLTYISNVLGRQIESRKDLTEEDALKILKAIREDKAYIEELNSESQP